MPVVRQLRACQAVAVSVATTGVFRKFNVNVVQQLVDMIETQRAYEVSSKSIKAVDEMQYVPITYKSFSY